MVLISFYCHFEINKSAVFFRRAMLFAIFPLKHKMLNPITLNERLHEDKILMGQKSFVPKYYDYIKKNVTLSLIDNSSGVHTILIVLLVPNQYIL